MSNGIKTQSKLLKIVGLIFYGITAIFIVLWVNGYDVEAFTALFTFVAVALHNNEKLADFISPPKKPVKDMTQSEFLELVRSSDAKLDWESTWTPTGNELFFKEDPMFRFRNTEQQNEDFIARWANCHPDPKAWGEYHDLYYGTSQIKRFLLVNVDGGRGCLPHPIGHTDKVAYLDYKVAAIHDGLDTLDEYMSRSHLQIEADS